MVNAEQVRPFETLHARPDIECRLVELLGAKRLAKIINEAEQDFQETLEQYSMIATGLILLLRNLPNLASEERRLLEAQVQDLFGDADKDLVNPQDVREALAGLQFEENAKFMRKGFSEFKY